MAKLCAKNIKFNVIVAIDANVNLKKELKLLNVQVQLELKLKDDVNENKCHTKSSAGIQVQIGDC